MSLARGTPICAKCKRLMHCKKNGFLVNDPEVDGFESTFWRGDLWTCNGCGAQVVIGFGRGFLQSDFNVSKEDSLEFKWN